MEVARKVVDGEARASGARFDAGCMVDSVATRGARRESRESASSWVVGKPTERGWRVWGAGVQHRCRWQVRGAGAQGRYSRENLGGRGKRGVQEGAQG